MKEYQFYRDRNIYKDKEAFLDMAKDLLNELEKLKILLTGKEKKTR